MLTLVFATNNPHKISEIRDVLERSLFKGEEVGKDFSILGLEDIGCNEDIPETADTLEGNASLKSYYVYDRYGYSCFADDTGLEAESLDGRPGVYSARYAGKGATDQDNLNKLLEAIKDIPEAERTARFQCVMVYLAHANDPTPLICQGTWEGRILFDPRGDNGFGYDPVFYVPTHDCSAAELESDVKNQLSHRGQALKKFIELMQSEMD